MNYHPYITGSNRVPSTSDRMNVFGPGTDPAGLGTLGAPVNTAHAFEYLGENLPPFGNPQEVVGRGARRWEQGFQDVYQGRFIEQEQDRLSPNTSTITLDDPEPLVSRPDEISEVKNNAQIAREMTQRSVRTYDAAPSADVLAHQVNADAEARNVQSQAVSMVYESQMDAIRAHHLGQHARGAALRGETIGALPTVQTSPGYTMTQVTLNPQKTTLLSSYDVQIPETVVGSPQETSNGIQRMVSPTGGAIVSESDEWVPEFEQTYRDSYYDPTKIALVLGGLGAAALVAFMVLRGR